MKSSILPPRQTSPKEWRRKEARLIWSER